MYSTRGISHKSSSIGRVTRSSTSRADDPGISTKTSIIGARICGSSSRGSISVAATPSSTAEIISSGVSFESTNRAANPPANPRAGDFSSFISNPLPEKQLRQTRRPEDSKADPAPPSPPAPLLPESPPGRQISVRFAPAEDEPALRKSQKETPARPASADSALKPESDPKPPRKTRAGQTVRFANFHLPANPPSPEPSADSNQPPPRSPKQSPLPKSPNDQSKKRVDPRYRKMEQAIPKLPLRIEIPQANERPKPAAKPADNPLPPPFSSQ